MARKTRIVLEDDLTGDVLEEGRGETLRFGLDGQSYEIDLSGDNARELREALKKYTQVGRKVSDSGRGRGGGRRVGAERRTSRQDTTAAIREWAQAQGHQVSERGRIPNEIVAAYEAAR